MYIVVDQREIVVKGYSSRFRNHGIAAYGFSATDFGEWITHAADGDIAAVEAFLIGDCGDRARLPNRIRTRSAAPIMVLSERDGVEQTLELFAAGADDVVRKPVDVREILARVAAMSRRAGLGGTETGASIGDITVHFDGRDPEVHGEAFPLPRRERRILEYLVRCQGRRVSRTQIFSAVYGVFDEDIDETVIESHISKLRKKLRAALGYDPINSKRFLGYALDTTARETPTRQSATG